MSDNLHAGHRMRTKKEFLDHGFDYNTPPHKVIETLLFYCVQRSDTNPLAHELINRYKNVSGVLDAPIDELAEFKGLTENSAVLLKMIMPIARIYNHEKRNASPDFKNMGEIGNFLLHEYAGYTTERVSMLCLNSNGRMLAYEQLGEGDVGSVGLSVRNVARLALDAESSGIVLAHNHPSGIALPSRADAEITQMLAESLSNLGVHLLDHIIVSDGDYVSMRESEEYSSLFTPKK